MQHHISCFIGRLEYVWNGPVTIDDDSNIVVVEQPEDILRNDETRQLELLLAPVASLNFSQEAMIAQYALAKSYINSYLIYLLFI